MRNYFKNKTVLVTGGTGSFGKSFVNYFISKKIHLKKIIVYSRDEFKQFEMAKEYPVEKYPFMRYFLGDVRDKDRLDRALNGVDIVIHAAALKQVPSAEYNPIEYIKTNILGAQNIIETSLDNDVKKVIALSTDKAASPINLYGATKLCSDKLFVAANNIKGNKNIIFSVIRYGNVMGSRGSVVPFFLEIKGKSFFPITDLRMTRFNISLLEAIKLVVWSIENLKGGEILVPKIPSYRIIDVANAVCDKTKKKIIGIRPGEKIHEEMITSSDSHDTYDFGSYFAIIAPNFIKNYKKQKLKKVIPGFSYNSGDNTRFLTIPEIKKLINRI
jgi:nucleoside-diphosphate-sugar epimerase